MAGISGANIKLCGSHAGTEIGPDGPSQMALEDLAAMRALHGSTVLYPADATAAAALTTQMVDTPGIVYLRTTRGAWPVLYPASEIFPVGGSKLLRAGRGDEVTLIGAGVTVPRRWPEPALLLPVRQCAVGSLPGSGTRGS
jgi:transketolase